MKHGAHIVASFTMPAVFSQAKQQWQYNALRFTITDQADDLLIQYVLSVVRS